MATELFANNAATSLAAALNSSATTLTVASSAAFPTPIVNVSRFRVIIDSELLIVTAISGTTWTVTRGAEGSVAAAHLIGADVTQIVTSGGLVAMQAPVGAVMMWVAPFSPDGWLFCQGQSLLRSDYPELFTVMGTAFGSVDGTHFTLPDLRDRFPMGASGTKALASAAGSATALIAHTHAHSHTFGIDHSATTTAGGASERVTDVGGTTGGTGTAETVTTSGASSHSAGSGTSSLNPYLSFNYIIKT